MISEIEFVSENFPLPFHLETMKSWIENTIKSEGKTPGTLTYVFLSDEELLRYNEEFLQHSYYTDIITFDQCEHPIIHGDILISYERVMDNASTQGIALENELARVIIHGILHLCGYGDKTSQEAEEMRDKEDFYLSKLHTEHSMFHVKQSN